jgi:REP element-mobilizing transposase RayT
MQRESDILEGHLMTDHLHFLISIPPKYSMAQVVGFIKGKSAIQIARTFGGRKRNLTGQHFLARGIFHVNGWPGRERHLGVYQETGTRGQKAGPTERA